MAHGHGDVDTAVSIARTAVDAIKGLPEEQSLLYSVVIQKSVSEAARKVLAMDPYIEKFFSEAQLQSFHRGQAEGEAKGEVKGKAEALIRILKRRGLPLTAEHAEDPCMRGRLHGRSLAG